MKKSADYLIVQHVADLFRRETRNLGVFVRWGDEISAKFFGEESPNRPIDRRSVRRMPYPSVYVQWVRYWRRQMRSSKESLWDDVQETATDHYRVVPGGMVDGVGYDSVVDVVNYLYAALVSEGGIAEAIGGPDEIRETILLGETVGDEFRSRSLLAEDDDPQSPQVKNPVRRNATVAGRTVHEYTPAFVQRGSRLVVMEPVDVVVKRDRSRMRDRAAFVSTMFRDITEAPSRVTEVDAISIVNASAKEEKEKYTADALAYLGQSSLVVNWQSENERTALIARLSALAMAG